MYAGHDTRSGVKVSNGPVRRNQIAEDKLASARMRAKAAFKITSISYDTTQAKWVVTYTDGYNERKYNGTVTVTGYSDVGCKTESATGTFFKATLD